MTAKKNTSKIEIENDSRYDFLLFYYKGNEEVLSNQSINQKKREAFKQRNFPKKRGKTSIGKFTTKTDSRTAYCTKN